MLCLLVNGLASFDQEMVMMEMESVDDSRFIVRMGTVTSVV